MFISFEGGEGSGKTTVINKLKETLIKANKSVYVTREPGGTKISEAIRHILLDNNSNMSFHTEALLFAASRAEHIDEVIKEKLKTHDIVITDRFLDSSIAYQAFGRDLGVEFILKINDYALNYMPDVTFYIDVEPKDGLARTKNRGKSDRLDNEALSFHEKVRKGYLEVAKMYPERIITIDGDGTVDDIYERVLVHLRKML